MRELFDVCLRWALLASSARKMNLKNSSKCLDSVKKKKIIIKFLALYNKVRVGDLAFCVACDCQFRPVMPVFT